MLKTLIRLCGLALIAGVMVTGFAEEKAAKVKTPKMGKVRHIVALKFKDTATAEQIKQVETSFAELKTKVPQIVTLEFGTNVSPEKLNKGFTHGFLLSFKTEKDRDAYLIHPDHKAFGDSLGPVLADVFVFDFVAEK